jgi:hypothetical protein
VVALAVSSRSARSWACNEELPAGRQGFVSEVLRNLRLGYARYGRSEVTAPRGIAMPFRVAAGPGSALRELSAHRLSTWSGSVVSHQRLFNGGLGYSVERARPAGRGLGMSRPGPKGFAGRMAIVSRR